LAQSLRFEDLEMLVEQFINLQWDTEVGADDILDATDADFVEVIESGAAYFNDVVPGRARVFLDENACIWQIITD
jgi:hypothetical protein